ncbi:MAG: hypothetical protein H7Z16_03790 [Pyrinomonadaceae bacterium]|nr:hypothetical protein [Pyrinomonadaceae bacterium]
MKRFLIAITLTCVLSVSALAGDIPTCGAPALPGDIPTCGAPATASNGTQSSPVVTVILAIIRIIAK